MIRKFSQMTPTREKRRAEVGGLVLTEFSQAPGLSIPRHAHESATILCVYRGRVADLFKNCVHECKSSSILIRPAEEFHSHRYGLAGADCLAIQIRQPRTESVGPLSPSLDRIAHLRNSRLYSLALLIRSELRLMDDVSPLAIEGLVLEMLAQSIRLNQRTKSSAPPSWLSDARDFIHEKYSEQLHLSEIARIVGVHPAHLAESFRKHFHCTVGEYMRNLRLQYAIQELTQTDKPLKAIALAAGFYDHSHFANTLKRYHGLTPTEIRATATRSKIFPKVRKTSKS